LKRSPTADVRITMLNQQLIDRLHLNINFGYLKSGSKTGEKRESLSTGQIVLGSGDSYRFEFTAENDCFLYVYQLDPDQKIVQLFPNSEFSSTRNPLQVDKRYRLPEGDNWFVLDQNSGQETIYFVASRWPAKDLGQIFKQLIDADDHEKKHGIRQKLLARLNANKKANIAGLEGFFYKKFSFQHEK